MRGKKRIVGFIKGGVIFERCNLCPDKSEKFRSTTRHEINGVLMRRTFNGIDWALNNGYTPIYSGTNQKVYKMNQNS